MDDSSNKILKYFSKGLYDSQDVTGHCLQVTCRKSNRLHLMFWRSGVPCTVSDASMRCFRTGTRCYCSLENLLTILKNIDTSIERCFVSRMNVALMKILDSVYSTEKEFTSAPFVSKWEHKIFVSHSNKYIHIWIASQYMAQYRLVLGLCVLFSYIPGIITENMS